jgi:hypothetical protein
MGILAPEAASDILRSAIVPSQSTSMNFMGNSRHFVPREGTERKMTELAAVGGKRG